MLKAFPVLDADCELRRSNKGLSQENAFNGILISFPGAVAFFFVLFHNRARGNFLCPAAVTSGALCTFLDVFIFALFFRAYTAQVLFSWHT
jgi:hypothetical protein